MIYGVRLWVSYLLCGFDCGRGGHDHENTVEQDRTDDEHRKQRMHEDIDGDSPDWIERVQEPEAIGRTESEDIFAFTDDDKGLQKKKQNNITRKQRRIITLC